MYRGACHRYRTKRQLSQESSYLHQGKTSKERPTPSYIRNSHISSCKHNYKLNWRSAYQHNKPYWWQIVVGNKGRTGSICREVRQMQKLTSIASLLTRYFQSRLQIWIQSLIRETIAEDLSSQRFLSSRKFYLNHQVRRLLLSLKYYEKQKHILHISSCGCLALFLRGLSQQYRFRLRNLLVCLNKVIILEQSIFETNR